MLLRFSIAALVVGGLGLAACDTGPTEPSPLTAPTQTLGGSTSGGSALGATDEARLESLRDQLAQLESTAVSAQSQHELDRLRALIAALKGQLSPGGGNGGGNGGDGGSDPPMSGPVTVSILGIRGSSSFSPNPVQGAGGMVRWRNDDGLTHRIVADDGSFDTGNLVAGATSAMVQPSNGGYHCSLHPTMVGSIGASSGGGGGGSGGDDDPYVLGR